MKKFMEGVMEWKTAASLFFTGSLILCTIIFYVMGKEALPIELIVSILIVSTVGTFIQFLAFSDYIIKKMRYTLRIIVFAVPFFALLAANAYFFYWFPMDSINWLVFIGVYLIVLVGMSLGFEIYYRVSGKRYEGLLGQYRKQKELKR
ncbi:hypothetical protein LJC01_02110 [Clostridiaceae bacterium OttesenSCG-928-D20]|nr:hypothetical protein [Clostridiaceae bacterium OttesenSCG-928-D20]